MMDKESSTIPCKQCGGKDVRRFRLPGGMNSLVCPKCAYSRNITDEKIAEEEGGSDDE